MAECSRGQGAVDSGGCSALRLPYFKGWDSSAGTSAFLKNTLINVYIKAQATCY